VRESGTGAMWVAPELLETPGAANLLDCAHVGVIAMPNLHENGRVVFEWHPDTGELSFAANDVKPAITLREDFSPELLATATATCGSR
jgi:hypothetical protein